MEPAPQGIKNEQPHLNCPEQPPFRPARQGGTGNAIAKSLGISLPSVQNIKKALGPQKEKIVPRPPWELAGECRSGRGTAAGKSEGATTGSGPRQRTRRTARGAPDQCLLHFVRIAPRAEARPNAAREAASGKSRLKKLDRAVSGQRQSRDASVRERTPAELRSWYVEPRRTR